MKEETTVLALQSLEGRLRRAEGRARKLMWVSVLLCSLCLSASWIVPTESHARRIESESFVITDGAGTIRAEIGSTSREGLGLVGMTLFDKQGIARIFLGLSLEDRPVLYLNDSQGVLRGAAGISLDEAPYISLTGRGSRIDLGDQNRKNRASLWLAQDGAPGWQLSDASGVPAAKVILDTQGFAHSSLRERGDTK